MKNYIVKTRLPLFLGLMILCSFSCGQVIEENSDPVAYEFVADNPDGKNDEVGTVPEQAPRILVCDVVFDAMEVEERTQKVVFGNFPPKPIVVKDRYTVPGSIEVYGKFKPTYEEIINRYVPLYPTATVDTILNIERQNCRWTRIPQV